MASNHAVQPPAHVDAATVPADVEAHLAAQLELLTPTQRKRLEALVAGSTPSAIARSEGVSPQAIDQTLRSDRVRRALQLVGTLVATSRVKTSQIVNGVAAQDAEPILVVQALVQNVVEIALGADRTVVAGRATKEVPDYRLRLEASLRLLDLLADSDRFAANVPAAGANELVARERETVSHTRTREIRATNSPPDGSAGH